MTDDQESRANVTSHDASEKLARDVVAMLVRHDFSGVAVRLTAELQRALPLEKLSAVWEAVIAGAGAFRSVERVQVSPQNGIDLVVLTCSFAKTRLEVRMAIDARLRVAGLFIVPDATHVAWEPPAYGHSKIHESNTWIGALRLPGKLVLPDGMGPFPAVVLVHGSGPHDEDESIGASKPFRDLALGLAAHGIASLRYVKRTRHAPDQFTVDRKYTVKHEALEDAAAAVEWLATVPEVTSTRIWVVGHSLGGYLAPRIARGNAAVAGIVLLAAPARAVEELAIEQVRYLSRGDPGAVARAEASARAIRDPGLAEDSVIDFLGARLPGSYFLDLRDYDPVATARELPIPVLVLQGERDYQVRDAANDWAERLAGHQNARIRKYPLLNHLFQSGSGESRPEEYLAPGQHIAEEVVRDIAAFIQIGGATAARG